MQKLPNTSLEPKIEDNDAHFKSEMLFETSTNPHLETRLWLETHPPFKIDYYYIIPSKDFKTFRRLTYRYTHPTNAFSIVYELPK
jgi:hypothetical protein